jgi:GNAT superfamily N-acetyltransferase
MKSLYGQYIKEQNNKEIIEDERGFATYFFTPDGCLVEDIFVVKEYRSKGVAKEMLDKISIIAKENGCKKMIGTVVPTCKGSTHSLQAALSYGFKLDSCRQNLICYIKEL